MAIDPNIKQKAEDIRTKVFGSEVRESLASGLEGMSVDVESIKGRQGNVESQFQNVIDETTGKDVIIAPELIAARNGKSNLKTRLDEEHAQVTKDIKVINNNLLNGLLKGFVAHRGFQPSAPENTLKAITEAGRRGYVMCEVDPNITSDGYWIVCHDETVDRTTDSTGAVYNMTLAQVQACKVDTPAQLIDADEVIRLPLLEDVVKEVAYWGMGLNIDGSKFRWDAAKAQYLWDLLKKYNIVEKSIISLPVKSDREVFKQYAPDLPICISPSVPNVDADLLEASNYKYSILAYRSSVLTDTIITKCNNENVPIYVWGADVYKDAYQWLNKGVNFVETNYILPGGGIAQ